MSTRTPITPQRPLLRSVRLIKSNFGADAEVDDPTIPSRASSRQCAVSCPLTATGGRPRRKVHRRVSRGASAMRHSERKRNRPARTRSRNCSGVSVGRVGRGLGFPTAALAISAAFFAALRASSCAICLVASSFASASTNSAGEPSRPTRWSCESTAWVDRRHFPSREDAERMGKRPPHRRGDFAGDAIASGRTSSCLVGNASGHLSRKAARAEEWRKKLAADLSPPPSARVKDDCTERIKSPSV
jgi:hypothetical protein